MGSSAQLQEKFSEIKKLNDLIIKLTAEDGLHTVRLDYQGVKRFKSGTMQHKFDTKANCKKVWREESVFKKLHLTMENKSKVLEYITCCFKNNKDIIASRSNIRDN